MFEFEKLEAYKKGKIFYGQIAKLLEKEALKDRAAKDQLLMFRYLMDTPSSSEAPYPLFRESSVNRAALSIVLNVAAGAG